MLPIIRRYFLYCRSSPCQRLQVFRWRRRKFLSSVVKYAFYVPKKNSFQIKIFEHNSNLAHQTTFCNCCYQKFPALTEVRKYLPYKKQFPCQSKKNSRFSTKPKRQMNAGSQNLKTTFIFCNFFTIMYTKTFLRKVHARYYQLPNEELSRVISDYFLLK